MRSCWPMLLFCVTVLFLIDLGGSITAADSAGVEYLPICNLPKCLNPRVTSKAGMGTANATAIITPRKR